MKKTISKIMSKKKAAERTLQGFGREGVRPVLQAIAHIPKALVSTPGLPPKKKK